MNVADLRKFIEGRDDNEELCVMLFEKSSFDFLPEDELVLTDEGWKKLVAEFESMVFRDVLQWLSDTSIEYAETADAKCDECGEVYNEAKGDGWCGLCVSCADKDLEEAK
jgi:hypothetical protein